VIKYEVIERADTSRMDDPHYTFFIDRVRIILRPQRASGDKKVYLSPRVDENGLTFTDLARSLPETDYSDETLGDKIVEAQEADVRDLIVGRLLTRYSWSSADKRRILLSLKSDINNTDLLKKSADLLAERNKVYPIAMELHLMTLEDLLNLFSGSDDGKREILANLI